MREALFRVDRTHLVFHEARIGSNIMLGLNVIESGLRIYL